MENGILAQKDLVENGILAQKDLVENSVLAQKDLVELDLSINFALKIRSMKDSMIYFKRKIYDTMLSWKRERNGDTALLIQGARRIGKSTIAEEFAKHEYQSYILIDFSNVSQEVSDLFNDISDLNYLFLR